KIEEYRRQIESAKHDLETLKRYPGAEQNIEDSEAQIKEVKTAIVDLENQLKALDERQAQAQAEVVIKKADFERVSQELDKIIQLQNATNDLLTRFPRLKASAIAGGTTEKELPLTADTRNAIQAELLERDRLREEILKSIREFVHKEILTDEKELAADSPTQEAVTGAVTQLEEVYRELPQRDEILHKQIATHNESVASYAELLTKN